MDKRQTRRDFLKVLGNGVIVSAVLPSFLASCASKGTGTVEGHRMVNLYDDDKDYLVSQLKRFTQVHQQMQKSDRLKCEIECMKIQYPLMFCEVEPGDLFAGRAKYPPVCLSPQAFDSGGYCLNSGAMSKLESDPDLSAEARADVREMMEYWSQESSRARMRKVFPPKMAEVLYSDNWTSDPLCGAPLYRLSGTQCDYDKLCRLGIGGLRKEIESCLSSGKGTPDNVAFWESSLMALDLFSEVALWYAGHVAEMLERADGSRKAELKKIEASLRNIAVNKPDTLHEAIQLVFLWAVMSGSINYGRMDEYLGDLYVNDIAAKRITEEDAIAMLSSLWTLIDSRKTTWDARVIVGGKGRRNESAADKFAFIAMETTKRVRGVIPQFTLRFNSEQDPRLYEAALDVIGTGNPYPMLYNDDVIIPAVMNAFRVPYEEAMNYLPFGCGEYILYHRSVGTPSGVINLAQILSLTLHKGINFTTGRREGIPAERYGDMQTFDDVMRCYKENVEHYVEQLAYHEKLEYDTIGCEAPYFYLSLLFDDCISRGKPVFDGGVRYLGGTLEAYGNTNTADSFAAIRKLVYDEKKLTLDQMVKILDADFKGYEKERMWMLDAPKYGNDDDYADALRVEVDSHICNFTRDMAQKAGMHSYLIVIINNNANVTMGEQTPATPDGRKAYTFLANANASTGGADKNGITAYLNSIVKPDITIHAGAVQNMAFSKETFNTFREKTKALLSAYFDNGGAQAMINCLGRGDLQAAMEHPEDYQNLIVRVGGFSAKFVDLPRTTQLEILSRTLY